MDKYKTEKSRLESEKAEAEAGLEGERVGEIEKALQELELKKQQFEGTVQNAEIVPDNQKKQVRELGGNEDVVEQKTEEVDARIEEVKESTEKQVEQTKEQAVEKEPQPIVYEQGKLFSYKTPNGDIIEVRGISEKVQQTNDVKPREYVLVKATGGTFKAEVETKNLMEKSDENTTETGGLEELRAEYQKLGEQIMEAPKKILSTMTPDEKRKFASENPNEASSLEEFLQDMDKFKGENGSVVFENSLKYIRFLGKVRGENYSKQMLPFDEVQAIRKQQEQIGKKISAANK